MTGFLLRWLFAFILVVVTFNPTGYSLYHWIWPLSDAQLPLKILLVILLASAYLFYITSTVKSLGLLGIILVFAFCGTLIWLFVDQGWLDLQNSGILAWIMIFIISVVLGLGISWSHIKKRITGQFDTDDIGE
ncbi:DUF6524 family protein [Marinicella litoralis]|uniref:Uncharacterized protein n=1 Tax=Marinicella litoralis TaxID=644220 RepID=A0A4R6XJF4_9GAMM|nr:DUF6524 family protein [Marinicella litoralis]TDR18479.1 hypothetical protein C8D91_2399 [Marinicella litoralis]